MTEKNTEDAVRQKNVRALFMGLAGVCAGMVILICYNTWVMERLALPIRIPLNFIIRIATAAVPFLVMRRLDETPADYGFERGHWALQIIIGLAGGVLLSLIPLVMQLTLWNVGDWLGSYTYDKPWQYVYEFLYCIFGVGLAEEFIFRGFVYERMRILCGGHLAAALWSSILFGLLHLFNGISMQVSMTLLIGLLFCLLRAKIPHCSTLSLIVLHGVYDFMLVVWAGMLY